MAGARRVAITGVGVVSPLGNSLAELHRSVAEARSGIGRLPEEVTQGSGVQVGAMAQWSPEALFTPAEVANIDRVSQFAIAAATQALQASRIALESENRER